ncbi:MAG: hypothetical protein DMF69_21030, partial [Acidobacteria bacterium]
GGMGDVYLALDTELDRAVALKVLPHTFAGDTQRMRRFIQEAKAASSLNHQNIITIYEIGDIDSTRFIATEFVEGITLRQQLKRGRLSLGESLEIGIQVATGLAAAHEAGIVHRDVKPENIMLRKRDGFVKLLDFGLVKLTEASGSATDTEAPTRALVNTDAGTVMGTVVYMSPEQARGKAVDERTDIWSLGVILYEMVTGVVPFAGESSADVIAAIVKTEPVPVTRLAPTVPSKLEEIISKSLEKDRDERYQTIKDLLVDLRRLKKRIDFESEIERSVTPGDHQSMPERSTMSGAGVSTVSLSTANPTSSAEYLVSEIKRHKVSVVFAVIGLTALLAAGLFTWSKLASGEKPVAPSMKITKLTSGGRVNNILFDGSTSISSDGKYVVYTLIDGGKVSIWARQLSTGNDLQIVPASDLRNGGTTISNDGDLVYFIGVNSENPNGSLFQVSLFGGTPRKVMSRVRSPVSFSPDGSQFAFVRENELGESMLMIANSDGTGERTLQSRRGSDWFAIEGPAWSPDGKSIACAAGTDTGGSYMSVFGYSVADGSETPLTAQKWHGDTKRVLWLKDGTGLIVPVQDSAQGSQLWLITRPDGNVRRITNDLNGYGGVSLGLSADSKTLVTVQSVPSHQLWTGPFNVAAAQPIQITHGDTDGLGGIDWTPDGQIVFVSHTGNTNELVAITPEGKGIRSLLKVNEPISQPAVSPDGKYIYFTSLRSGTAHIWRINIDGADLKQLTFGDFADFAPLVSTDGKWVFFQSWRSGLNLLWKVPGEGGDAIKVTDVPTTQTGLSPDGKSLSVVQLVSGGTPPRQLAVMPVDGSSPAKFIPTPAHFNLRSSIPFSLDGRGILVKSDQGGIGNLWLQPINGGSPKQITNFNSDLISNFAISRDGKRLAISRGNTTLDVVLIKDFR